MEFIPSLGLVFLFGLAMGRVAERVSLPPLLGMIVSGILLGESGLGLLGSGLTGIAADLRKVALVVILLKAGLTLDSERLRSVGRPALLLSFLPAMMEILACTFLAPRVFGVTVLEGMLLGTVLAAVSPAVVVPRMVSFIERGIGKGKQMPEIVLAGASLDDVFVMVLFSTCLSLVAGGDLHLGVLLEIPVSVVTGCCLGLFFGKVLSGARWFSASGLEQQILVLFGLSCGFFGLEAFFPFSALLTVMTLGLTVRVAQRKALASGLTSLWKGAEVLLFVLLGSEVDVASGFALGLSGVLVLGFGLLFRTVGVFLATKSPQLGKREQMFAVISYLPKATVQAGIGGLPLAMGLDCGSLVLTMAVLSILITAPLGAICIDRFGEKLLEGESH